VQITNFGRTKNTKRHEIEIFSASGSPLGKGKISIELIDIPSLELSTLSMSVDEAHYLRDRIECAIANATENKNKHSVSLEEAAKQVLSKDEYDKLQEDLVLDEENFDKGEKDG